MLYRRDSGSGPRFCGRPMSGIVQVVSGLGLAMASKALRSLLPKCAASKVSGFRAGRKV